MIDFLQASAVGSVFYSRLDKGFHAYRLDLGEDYPGYVLLDATAKVSGLVSLNPTTRMIDVPPIDYSPLQIFTLRHPDEFSRIKELSQKRGGLKDYGEYVKAVVIANTATGDDVLVVVHSALLNHDSFPDARDPSKPHEWEGRRINTLNWGAGVGTNRFRDKTHVFLFHEFHPRRSQTISQRHGWGRYPLSAPELKLAEGKLMPGGTSAPQGAYGDIHEGHILSWTKQLASRGCIRKVDAQGRCSPMKLFTTMDQCRLLRSLHKLFPGAPLPKAAKVPETYLGRGFGSKRERLLELLLKGEKQTYSAAEVQSLTGIRSNALKRELRCELVRPFVDAYGWKCTSAKSLGEPGKSTYLVKLPRQLMS